MTNAQSRTGTELFVGVCDVKGCQYFLVKCGTEITELKEIPWVGG